MTTIRAHFDGRAIIPDEPVNLPLDEPLTVHIDTQVAPAESITGEELAKSDFAGLWKDRTDIGDTLEFARELRRRSDIRGGGPS